MADNQQNLSPEEQDSLFQLLQKAGALSKDQGQSTNTPDTSAQQGTGGVDFNTLQSLLKHASNPSAVPMQEDDKMHPMDAISQISQQLQGGTQNQQPTQQLQQPDNRIPININAQRNGLLPELFRLKTPGMSVATPMRGFAGAIGMKSNTPVGPNYAQAVPPELQKFLPSPTYKMPDGSNYVSKDDIDQARMMAMSQSLIQNRQNANQLFTSKDQLTSQGIPEDIANNLLAANPNGVTNKEIGNYFTSERASAANTMAQSRSIMAGNAKLLTALKVGGFDGANKAASQANTNILLAQKAQALVDQITSNGGVANIRQQAELGRNLAALVATNNGVVTDEGMNSMIPKTAMKGFAGWQEYFTNSQKPIDFTGFLPQMQDLLTREKAVNVGIANSASQLGINIMGAMGQSSTGKAISKARNASPLVSGNPVPQTTTSPQSQPGQPPINNFTPDVLAYAQKHGITPQRALQIKIQRTGR